MLRNTILVVDDERTVRTAMSMQMDGMSSRIVMTTISSEHQTNLSPLMGRTTTAMTKSTRTSWTLIRMAT